MLANLIRQQQNLESIIFRTTSAPEEAMTIFLEAILTSGSLSKIREVGVPGQKIDDHGIFALLNITKSYAAELASSSIFVNAVAPGPTLTAMYDQLPQSRKDAVMRSVHVRRPCNPEEVARVIVWLGIESPDYVSGTTVDVNSGSYPR